MNAQDLLQEIKLLKVEEPIQHKWADHIWQRLEQGISRISFDHLPIGRLEQFHEQLNFVDETTLGLAKEIWLKSDPEKVRLLDSLNMLSSKIIDEMINNLNKPSNQIDRSLAIQFFTKTLKSMVRIANPQVDMPPTSMEDWEELQVDAVYFGDNSISNYVLQQDWIARAMYQQRDLSLTERQKWLKEFMNHVVSVVKVYEPENAARSYAAPATLDINRGVNGLSEVLGDRHVDQVLIVGPGDGKRVDGPEIDRLIAGGVVATGARVDGLEMLEVDNPHPTISMNKGDLLQLNEVMKGWQGMKQLIIINGSSLTNMDALIAHDKYWDNLSFMAAEGAILVMDEAALEPVITQNRRVAQTEKLIDKTRPVGDVPINRDYQREGDTPNEVGARIIPLLEKLAMARLHGWECVNLPRMGSPEWWELMNNIQDREWLNKQTNEQQNAFTTPFYLAGETEEGIIARSTLIFKRVKKPAFNYDLISSLRQSFWLKQDPLQA